jgi:hypothetical protein
LNDDLRKLAVNMVPFPRRGYRNSDKKFFFDALTLLSPYEKKLRGILIFVSITDISNWIHNYLLDIIQAYKGVVKEKKALEANLSALTEVKPLYEQNVLRDNLEPNQSTGQHQLLESTDVSTEESAEKNTVYTP